MIAEADKAFGHVDILVNVAGLTDRGTILDTSPELFDRMFAVNVRAPFFLMQDAAKIMRREKIQGRIVNILVACRPMAASPSSAAYCGSKGALAHPHQEHRLRADAATTSGSTASTSAGWIRPASTPSRCAIHHADPKWLEGRGRQPFGRLIKPDEVARAVAFLTSEESGLITGSIIDFDQSVSAPTKARRIPAARSGATGDAISNEAAGASKALSRTAGEGGERSEPGEGLAGDDSRETLTLPTLRVGPLPLPRCGRG